MAAASTDFRDDPSQNPRYNWPYKKLPALLPPEPQCWIAAWCRKKGSRPVFVTEKKLTATDLNTDENRFLLPRDGVRQHLCPQLTQEERDSVGIEDPDPDHEQEKKKKKNKNKKKGAGGVAVKVLDWKGREYDMTFKYWPSSRAYVFNGAGWKQFLEANTLEEGQLVPLFFFHAQQGCNQARTLWFVMAVETPEQLKRRRRTRRRMEEKMRRDQEDNRKRMRVH